jgi:hypothetical protein
MVLKVDGGESSMPNRIGTLSGTKAHILITRGISSPVSLDTADPITL